MFMHGINVAYCCTSCTFGGLQGVGVCWAVGTPVSHVKTAEEIEMLDSMYTCIGCIPVQVAL